MARLDLDIERVLDKVRAFFGWYQPVPHGGRILVAVSGGPDSVVLLDTLVRLRQELQCDLHVAHLNHMFRGEEAGEDARYVKELAEDRCLPCTVAEVNVPGRLGPEGGGKQQEARAIRYTFLMRTARRVGACAVATGHNRDDQAETVMWRILRGTSLRGLGGIPPVRGMVIRPLLQVWRSEIEDYVRVAGLSPRTDRSNLQTGYTRNWIRLELFPCLERVNPAVRRALADLGDVARDDNALLDQMSDERFQDVARVQGREIHLDRYALASLARPLARRVVLRSMEMARPGVAAELGRGHLDAVLSLVNNGRTGSRLDLPGSAKVRLQTGVLVVSGAPARGAVIVEQTLQVPGFVELGDGRVIEARLHSQELPELSASPEVAYIDYRAIRGPLRVRSRQPGDRFKPLGMTGTQKVKDYLIDKKIPVQLRQRVPVVVCDDGVVWLAGLRLDDRFRVVPSTDQVLELRLTVQEQ
ncbi:MAG: tRNA lysidine(34) synthetase TilS [Bacillota bacterium]